LPKARNPDRGEARLLQLFEGSTLVPDGVVYCPNQKRGAIAAAAAEECRCYEPRTAKGALVRTSGFPGRVGCTSDTESWYQPGATLWPSLK